MSFTKSSAFGIVTVMNVKAYAGPTAAELTTWSAKTPKEIIKLIEEGDSTVTPVVAPKTPLCSLNHLQTSNLTASGPDISIQGGQTKSPLIKYGKSMRCEITDALGQKDCLVALGGAEEDSDHNITITDRFPGPVTLIGDAFFIDQASGDHVACKVIMYQFLPDAVPSFNFDMNNAAVFDLNGDLISTEIQLSSTAGAAKSNCFYSFSSSWTD